MVLGAQATHETTYLYRFSFGTCRSAAAQRSWRRQERVHRHSADPWSEVESTRRGSSAPPQDHSRIAFSERAPSVRCSGAVQWERSIAMDRHAARGSDTRTKVEG